jgi:hypothetical protein
LGTAATTGLLYQPRKIGDGDCEEIGGMKCMYIYIYIAKDLSASLVFTGLSFRMTTVYVFKHLPVIKENIFFYSNSRSRDSAVGIATGYRLDD